ncbi:serine/threonine protein kinase, partial [Streptomyces sp. T-3]|nr:serine/threonine protein kinase [Streptomyces sp. T-3]
RRVPANPRLLRQRLIVFVVVTLLVALGIAAAQGCQGPANGLGRLTSGQDVREVSGAGEPGNVSE